MVLSKHETAPKQKIREIAIATLRKLEEDKFIQATGLWREAAASERCVKFPVFFTHLESARLRDARASSLWVGKVAVHQSLCCCQALQLNLTFSSSADAPRIFSNSCRCLLRRQKFMHDQVLLKVQGRWTTNNRWQCLSSPPCTSGKSSVRRRACCSSALLSLTQKQHWRVWKNQLCYNLPLTFPIRGKDLWCSFAKRISHAVRVICESTF